MRTRINARATAIACIILLTGILGFAQAGQGQGRLSGTVRDEAGDAVEGATVWLQFAKAGRRMEARTDLRGNWAFIGVGSGQARIMVVAEGYQGVLVNALVSQLQPNKPVQIVLKPLAASPLKTAVLKETSGPATERDSAGEVVTLTYTLRYVSPEFIRQALRVYFMNCSFSPESSLISVVLEKSKVAQFEEQLRKLDVEKKTITLRVFTVIAAKEGKSDAIENKDLKHVLAEVSNLLNFKSYVLDGASAITVRDGADFGRLALSTSLSEGLRFDYKGVSILTANSGKRSVKLAFKLQQQGSNHELLSAETEIAEDGYLVAGVSRIGNEGKSLVLVINAEIK